MRISFSSTYNFKPSAVLSTEDLKLMFLGGINLSAPNKRGESLQEGTINAQIALAQRQVERMLDIRLALQKIIHTNSFFKDDWRVWGFIPVSYPVVSPISITGYLGNVKHISYPKDWLSSKQSNTNTFFRKLYLIPYSTSVSTFGSGAISTPLFNIFASSTSIPNYWNISYITGYDVPPLDIIGLIGRLAAANLLSILGDLMNPIPGASSYSISLDGLSQNTSTVANSKTGIYGARISQLQLEIASELPDLLDFYKGVNFIVM